MKKNPILAFCLPARMQRTSNNSRAARMAPLAYAHPFRGGLVACDGAASAFDPAPYSGPPMPGPQVTPWGTPDPMRNYSSTWGSCSDADQVRDFAAWTLPDSLDRAFFPDTLPPEHPAEEWRAALAQIPAAEAARKARADAETYPRARKARLSEPAPVKIGPVSMDSRYVRATSAFFGNQPFRLFYVDELSPVLLIARDGKRVCIMPMRIA